MKKEYKQSKNYNEILYINFIQEMLNEYYTYDDKIEDRINEILENLKMDSKNYLKDQENINKLIESDKQLNIIPKLEKHNPKAYQFVKKRYFEKKNLKKIMEQLNLFNPTELFNLEFTAIRYIGNKMRNSKDFLRGT